MRTGLGFTEKMCSTERAKATMHLVAAVCDALKVSHLALNDHICGGEAHAHGGVARGDVLTNPAPTQSCDYRPRLSPISNRRAQTSPGYGHSSDPLECSRTPHIWSLLTQSKAPQSLKVISVIAWCFLPADHRINMSRPG